MANVIFKQGTLAQYEALATKDANTLYWLTDVQELRKGEMRFGAGAEASEDAAGLMSVEDKAAVEKLKEGSVKSGEFKTVETADQPYDGAVVGDRYIDITLNDADENHVYIPAPGMSGGAPEWGDI